MDQVSIMFVCIITLCSILLNPINRTSALLQMLVSRLLPTPCHSTTTLINYCFENLEHHMSHNIMQVDLMSVIHFRHHAVHQGEPFFWKALMMWRMRRTSRTTWKFIFRSPTTVVVKLKTSSIFLRESLSRHFSVRIK